MKISGGVVHELPIDLRKALTHNPEALNTWEDITPLARNEWICWIISAKKLETRNKRIEWGCSNLKKENVGRVVGPVAHTVKLTSQLQNPSFWRTRE